MIDAMPAADARRILRRLGWRQLDAAHRLGVSRRTLQTYLAQGGALPPRAAELLRLQAAASGAMVHDAPDPRC